MSISPLISGFGFTIGFGNIGPTSEGRQLSDRQTTSGGGQLVGSPSKRGLHACAGGVTGAVPHMVKKISGSISSLFIIFSFIII